MNEQTPHGHDAPGTDPETEPDAVVADATEAEAEDKPKEWWDDEKLPWAHKPTKADMWCWGALSFYGIYGLVMLPLRAWLLTVPFVSAWLNGSRTALVAVGAKTSLDPDRLWWWMVATWVVASISAIKFDWIFWWAGRLWGDNIMKAWAGDSPRVQKFTGWLKRIGLKYPTPALALTYLHIPFTPVIYAALGMAGVSFRKFMLLNLAMSSVAAAVYLGLGWWIGQPVVDVLEVYSRYAMWVALALLAFVLIRTWLKARKEADAA